MRIARGAAVAVAGLVCWGCAAESGSEGDAYRDRLLQIGPEHTFQSVVVVDRHGRHLATVAPEGYRVWVPLNEVPDALRMAAVATEDQTFYSNTGVDPSAVARAALQNAQAGQTVSGASTITMQLVRMVAFPDEERFERTLDRKVREAQLASELALRLSKDEILEAYLNVAYFGQRAYGVEAAAHAYFGRPVRHLSLAQSALLAGLPQAPAALDPFAHPDAALARRAVVLRRMVEVGVITPDAADAAAQEPLELVPGDRPRQAGHFVDHVVALLPELIGSDLAARGGFTVTTTLDLELHHRLQDLAAEHVAGLAEEHEVGDAAVVVLRPGSGEVLALVGGIDYEEAKAGQVNVATRPRQPGSAIKPVVYAAALENGFSTASLLWDIPFEYTGAAEGDVYQPTNYDDKYRGPVRLRDALANSLNAATIGLAGDIGVEPIHDTAGRLGLDLGDPDRLGLSVALGAAEVPLLDLTAAYAALADHGRWVAPSPVLAVETFRGRELLRVPAPARRQAVSAQTAWLVTSVLSDSEARRDAFGAHSPLETSRPAAVKTGTTSDFRDNLTIGYTPYVAVGVWTGNKDGSPMHDVLGITGAAPIWQATVEHVFADDRLMTLLGDGSAPGDQFAPPEGVVAAKVCALRTLGLDGSCTAVQEYFAAADASSNRAWAYGWFDVSAGCSRPAERGEGRIMLTGPADPELARQVAEWARVQGIEVAPASCDGAPARVASVSYEDPRP